MHWQRKQAQALHSLAASAPPHTSQITTPHSVRVRSPWPAGSGDETTRTTAKWPGHKTHPFTSPPTCTRPAHPCSATLPRMSSHGTPHRTMHQCAHNVPFIARACTAPRPACTTPATGACVASAAVMIGMAPAAANLTLFSSARTHERAAWKDGRGKRNAHHPTSSMRHDNRCLWTWTPTNHATPVPAQQCSTTALLSHVKGEQSDVAWKLSAVPWTTSHIGPLDMPAEQRTYLAMHVRCHMSGQTRDITKTSTTPSP